MTKYTQLTRPPAGPVEIDAPYVEDDERFVVALVVGYSSSVLQTKGKPVRVQALQAAAAALSLTTDESSDDTFWSVYDRRTKQLFQFEQGEFADLFVP